MYKSRINTEWSFIVWFLCLGILFLYFTLINNTFDDKEKVPEWSYQVMENTEDSLF